MAVPAAASMPPARGPRRRRMVALFAAAMTLARAHCRRSMVFSLAVAVLAAGAWGFAPHARASDEATFVAAYNAAAKARKAVRKAGFEWRDLRTLLRESKKLGKKGEYEKAIELANRARRPGGTRADSGQGAGVVLGGGRTEVAPGFGTDAGSASRPVVEMWFPGSAAAPARSGPQAHNCSAGGTPALPGAPSWLYRIADRARNEPCGPLGRVGRRRNATSNPSRSSVIRVRSRDR